MQRKTFKKDIRENGKKITEEEKKKIAIEKRTMIRKNKPEILKNGRIYKVFHSVAWTINILTVH